jgi:hypothetical protein
MFGRFLVLGICASIGTAAWAAPPALARSDAGNSLGRVRVTCAGTMVAAGQSSPGPIVSAGLIDFGARMVRGFGMGSQPILVLTAAEIDFGSAPPAGSAGTIVEGSIDRRSGVTRIVLRSSREPEKLLIESRLECEFEQPVS